MGNPDVEYRGVEALEGDLARYQLGTWFAHAKYGLEARSLRPGGEIVFKY
jgi:hypothetical protein